MSSPTCLHYNRNMAVEFVISLNQNTFPESQELPHVYAESCYHGRREIYITSAQRVRFRVQIETETNRPIVLTGERWRMFSLENLSRAVRMLHFVEEGDDCFFVTGYTQDGAEFGGYHMNAGRFSRFQSRVFSFYDQIQTLPAAFLGGLGNAQQIRIKVDGENFDVGLNAVEAGGANGQLLYELDPDDWNKLEESVGLKAGMILIFTRKRATKFLLTGFSREGSLTKDAHFLGATSLLPDQPGLLLTERDDNRLKHIFQWPSHQDHFGEGHAFYKRLSTIRVNQELDIPADFLLQHPIHPYRKVLMRHRGVECFMSMTMKPHKADPEMAGGVTVYGMWRKFAADCSFATNKLIRFKFMYFNVDVSGGDHLQDSVYPVFHLC